MSLALALGCAVLASAAAARPESRSLGARLTGSELLIELERVAPGPEAPGVYACNPGEPLRRIVTYGATPVWSGDHRRFCYTTFRGVWVAEISGQTEMGRQLRFLRSPVGGYAQILAPPAVWLPDNQSYVKWMPRPAPQPKPLPGPGEPAPDYVIQYITPNLLGGRDPALDEDVVLRRLFPDEPSHIGRLSVSPDGRRVCYEHGDFVDEYRVGRCQVALADLLAARGVDLRIPGAQTVMNPLWSPDGQRIAVEVVDGNRLHGVGFYWVADGRFELVCLAERPGMPARLVEWSPNGRQLIIIEEDAAGLWDVGAGAPPRRLRNLSSTPFTPHCLHFSPDGRRVAVLNAQRLVCELDGADTVAVTGLDKAAGDADVVVPEGMRVRWFDW